MSKLGMLATMASLYFLFRLAGMSGEPTMDPLNPLPGASIDTRPSIEFVFVVLLIAGIVGLAIAVWRTLYPSAALTARKKPEPERRTKR